jgi:hypothetical protein
MKKYELLHEVYDKKTGEPTRSQSQEIETENVDDYLKSIIDPASTYRKMDDVEGSSIFEVTTFGLKERYVFTEYQPMEQPIDPFL